MTVPRSSTGADRVAIGEIRTSMPVASLPARNETTSALWASAAFAKNDTEIDRARAAEDVSGSGGADATGLPEFPVNVVGIVRSNPIGSVMPSLLNVFS